MYGIGVSSAFTAWHFLTGGDWGAENDPHPHHYRVEVELWGAELDRHGFLADIAGIEARVEGLVARYRERVLNDLPEFEGRNPSVERFARVLCEALAEGVQRPRVRRLRVRIWENERAWGAYQMGLRCASVW